MMLDGIARHLSNVREREIEIVSRHIEIIKSELIRFENLDWIYFDEASPNAISVIEMHRTIIRNKLDRLNKKVVAGVCSELVALKIRLERMY